MKTEFSSAKLSKPFLLWLKVEAACKGRPMYEVLENLVAQGLKNRRPWDV